MHEGVTEMQVKLQRSVIDEHEVRGIVFVMTMIRLMMNDKKEEAEEAQQQQQRP